MTHNGDIRQGGCDCLPGCHRRSEPRQCDVSDRHGYRRAGGDSRRDSRDSSIGSGRSNGRAYRDRRSRCGKNYVFRGNVNRCAGCCRLVDQNDQAAAAVAAVSGDARPATAAAAAAVEAAVSARAARRRRLRTARPAAAAAAAAEADRSGGRGAVQEVIGVLRAGTARAASRRGSPCGCRAVAAATAARKRTSRIRRCLSVCGVRAANAARGSYCSAASAVRAAAAAAAVTGDVVSTVSARSPVSGLNSRRAATCAATICLPVGCPASSARVGCGVAKRAGRRSTCAAGV